MTVCLLNSFYFSSEAVPRDECVAIKLHQNLFLEKERR